MRAWSSAVSATTSVPSRRRSTGWPVSFSSSAAKSGHSAWLRRPSAISFSSPGSASAHTASMPAAAWLAPDPAAARSNKVTAAPRWASRQPIPSPMTPAPMISAVGVSVDRRWTVAIGGSLRWHDPDRFDGFDLSRVLRHPRPSDPIIGSLARSGKAFTTRLGAAAECQAPRRRSHRRGLLPQQPRNEHTHQQHDGAAERESRHGSEMDQAEAVEQRSDRLAHEEEERMQRHRRAARARGDLRRLHLDAAVQHVEPEPDEPEDRHLRRPRNSDRSPEQRKRRHGCPAQHEAVGAEFSEQRADHQGVGNPAQGEPAQNQTRDRSSRFASGPRIGWISANGSAKAVDNSATVSGATPRSLAIGGMIGSIARLNREVAKATVLTPARTRRALRRANSSGVSTACIRSGSRRCGRPWIRLACHRTDALASRSNSINVRTSPGKSLSGIILGPSEGARSGSSWVSMKIPATPTATAARASTGTNSRSPPETAP